jgi:hypothetical protein
VIQIIENLISTINLFFNLKQLQDNCICIMLCNDPQQITVYREDIGPGHTRENVMLTCLEHNRLRGAS